MKTCPSCSGQNDDNAAVCRFCGANIGYPPYQNQNQYYQQNNQQYNAYPNGYQSTYDPRVSALKNDISTAKTLGIVSIVFIFFMQLVTFVCSLLGISKANSAIEQAKLINDPYLLKEAEDAKKMNKIALIVTIIIWAVAIISCVLMAILGVGLFSAGASDYF